LESDFTVKTLIIKKMKTIFSNVSCSLFSKMSVVKIIVKSLEQSNLYDKFDIIIKTWNARCSQKYLPIVFKEYFLLYL